MTTMEQQTDVDELATPRVRLLRRLKHIKAELQLARDESQKVFPAGSIVYVNERGQLIECVVINTPHLCDCDELYLCERNTGRSRFASVSDLLTWNRKAGLE